jgi:hypothetical protein
MFFRSRTLIAHASRTVSLRIAVSREKKVVRDFYASIAPTPKSIVLIGRWSLECARHLGQARFGSIAIPKIVDGK